MAARDVAIGISLGNTHSCVAVWHRGEVQVVTDPESGERTVPSYVSFLGNECLVGAAAKCCAATNPANTVYGVQQLMGCKFSDKAVQRNMHRWPFNVVESAEGKPLIEVTFQGTTQQFSPAEINAMLLQKLKAMAEAHLGKEVTKAVLTVPPYYADTQRLAIKDAARLAGLTVERIITEPSAAAIACGLDCVTPQRERRALIFDLGGSKFDVAVLSIESGAYEILATAGATDLCGEEIDSRLAAHLAAEFQRQRGGHIDLSTSPGALRRLREAAERAKRVLSAAAQTTVEIDSVVDGVDFCTTITRARFEQLCDDLFRAAISHVERVLADANVKKGDADDVVLVGGSTRVPKVRQLLSDFFNGKELNTSIEPDEIVARGAATQGYILSYQAHPLDFTCVLDVAALTLGVECASGLMLPVIRRNMTLPTRQSVVLSTDEDNQAAVRVVVCEGERAMAKDNRQQGWLDVTGIQPAPRGVPQIQVTFDIDVNGSLTVSAVDLERPGSIQSLTLTDAQRSLGVDDVAHIVKEAARLEATDKEHREAFAGVTHTLPPPQAT